MQRPFVSILLWYGKLPAYTPWFLRSVAENPDLHLLWIGDNPPNDTPQNVTSLKLSLADLSERVRFSLGIRFEPFDAYKLCDLKPALGLLFQQEIGEAEYWGPIDSDIILGNFRNFIPAIRSSDVFSCREHWFSASFAFLKNNPQCRELFMQSPDWQQALEDPACQLFDECGRSTVTGLAPFPELRNGIPLSEIPVNYFSFSHLLGEPATGLKLSFADRCKESLRSDQLIRVDKNEVTLYRARNSVYRVGYGFTHYHMVAEKSKPYFRIPALKHWQEVPENYFIAETGFYRSPPSWYRISADRILNRIGR